MRIGLVRRGYSGSGGAEAYLLRFAEAAAAAGHDCALFTTRDWPREAWPDHLHAVRGDSPIFFAKGVEHALKAAPVDVLFSLERVFACDVYRAGDGVHTAWLERRAKFEP